MSDAIQAYDLYAPVGEPTALVCDSPHSGTHYPDDFGYAVQHALLRRGEDTDVDALWSAAPQVGAALLAARFPRTYIDANRTLEDLDPELLAEPWPEPVAPGEKSRLGYGLIWRNIGPGRPIYDRPLTLAQVRTRIDRYYRPYHAELARLIEDRAERFGGVWHLNLHSMPNDAYQRLQIVTDQPLADFVLGDRDGATCEPAFVDLVERELRACGYSVARNDPYKGVQLIERIGQPARNRHSLQVEIRRPLYMDEATRARNEGFATLQRDLTQLLQRLADYVRDRTR
jgi:N-formylglutamate deformylase